VQFGLDIEVICTIAPPNLDSDASETMVKSWTLRQLLPEAFTPMDLVGGQQLG
jgi:hypothetical protein